MIAVNVNTEPLEVTIGSGNVFADLGYPKRARASGQGCPGGPALHAGDQSPSMPLSAASGGTTAGGCTLKPGDAGSRL